MKISIITVVFNGERYIENCIQSILLQTYKDIEYIIVDGASTDSTLSIIDKYKSKINKVLSEKDSGLYDAINKGIKLASGDFVGILNADDMLANNDVIQKIAIELTDRPEIDGLYGDLNYVNPINNKIIRQWKSKSTTYLDIQSGWMPAHPTLYLKRNLFQKYGHYALDMGTAGDYDLILRYFYKYKIKTIYLPNLMINMRTGGLSNQSLRARLLALKYDYKALKRNAIKNPFLVLLKKKFNKINQFRLN